MTLIGTAKMEMERHASVALWLQRATYFVVFFLQKALFIYEDFKLRLRLTVKSCE